MPPGFSDMLGRLRGRNSGQHADSLSRSNSRTSQLSSTSKVDNRRASARYQTERYNERVQPLSPSPAMSDVGPHDRPPSTPRHSKRRSLTNPRASLSLSEIAARLSTLDMPSSSSLKSMNKPPSSSSLMSTNSERALLQQHARNSQRQSQRDSQRQSQSLIAVSDDGSIQMQVPVHMQGLPLPVQVGTSVVDEPIPGRSSAASSTRSSHRTSHQSRGSAVMSSPVAAQMRILADRAVVGSGAGVSGVLLDDRESVASVTKASATAHTRRNGSESSNRGREVARAIARSGRGRTSRGTTKNKPKNKTKKKAGKAKSRNKNGIKAIQQDVDNEYMDTTDMDESATEGLRDFSHISESVESLPTLFELLNTDDPPSLLFATITVRRLLSVEFDVPIQNVVDLGFVPRFVELLGTDDQPTLQFEAAWVLTNVASGTSNHTQCVIRNGAVPAFVRLLASPVTNVREQAVWAIGNISGDSAATRDLVLKHGALGELIKLAARTDESAAAVSMQKNIAWTFSNFCRGSPPPPLDAVAPMLPTVYSFVKNSKDEEVLTDTCWALAYLSDCGADQVHAVLNSDVAELLVNKLLFHPSPWVTTPALRTAGNIVTGDQYQTQIMLDHGILPALKKILQEPNLVKLLTEACWAVSNITAGTVEQLQMVIDHGLIDEVVRYAGHAEFSVAKEAIWALSNATTAGTIQQRSVLVDKGVIPALASALKNEAWRRQSRFIFVTLEAIENLLRAGNNLDRSPGESRFAVAMREHGAYDLIASVFSKSEKEDVRVKAIFIAQQYFDDQDGSTGDLADGTVAPTNTASSQTQPRDVDESIRPHPVVPKPYPAGIESFGSEDIDPAKEVSPEQKETLAKTRAQAIANARANAVKQAKRASLVRRKRQDLTKQQRASPPPQFFCPISQELMVDPVVTLDGQCYDRYNIQRWFNEGNNSSPVTGKELRGLTLVPNHGVRQMIEALWAGFTAQADPKLEWDCSACTVHNTADLVVCYMCYSARPHPRPDVMQKVLDEVNGVDNKSEKGVVPEVAAERVPSLTRRLSQRLRISGTRRLSQRHSSANPLCEVLCEEEERDTDGVDAAGVGVQAGVHVAPATGVDVDAASNGVDVEISATGVDVVVAPAGVTVDIAPTGACVDISLTGVGLDVAPADVAADAAADVHVDAKDADSTVESVV